MALLSLIVSALNNRPNPSIDRIPLDAFINEDFQKTATLTAHPIEDGSTVADHLIRRPETLRVSGMVSDSPIRSFPVPTPTPFAANVIAIANRAGVGRMKTAREGLIDLFDNPRLVTITTVRVTYVNYILIDLSIPNNPATGGKFDFEASFQKAKIVQAETRLLSVLEKQNLEVLDERGKVLKEQLEEAQKEGLLKNETALYWLGQKTGNLLGIGGN